MIALSTALALVSTLFLSDGPGGERVLPVTAGYFGETLAHPGLYVGTERSLAMGFGVEYGVGGYVHYRYQSALFASVAMSWRLTTAVGYTFSLAVGIGYLHAFRSGGPTYTVYDSGQVEETTDWGSPSFMPSFKLGLLGWDFRTRAGLPWRVSADAIAFGQYPINDFMMPHAALLVSATYFWSIEP